MKFGILNLWSAGIVVLLLVPNLLYALRHRDAGLSSPNRAINTLEQVGRYGSMLFMVVPLGVPGGEFGFCSPEGLMIWLAGMSLLLAAYYICWVLYTRKPGRCLALALAVLPSALFLVHGLLLRHPALCVFAGIFAASHIYIVHQSTRNR